MIKFLIQRPIAVLMAFTACFILGLVTYFSLPVSLLPDIAIPEITVQVSAENTSARELENAVVKPLRQQLIQVAKLEDLHSETRDGAGVIRLSFDYGTRIDLAFIEVNEKIDAAMSYLPKDIDRPKVVKASATDIPVFYLNLTLKADSAFGRTDEKAFLELCEFAENVIRRRIEQLPEVAMVDVTGVLERELHVVPDPDKLAVLGLSVEDIEQVLAQNNVEPGSMTVRDGYYEYNIKFSTLLRTEDDVRNILLRKEGRIIRLGDFCDVNIVPAEERGVVLSNGKRAVTLAVIKQADETMADMKAAVSGTVDYFRQTYPDIDFCVSRNQTELLDYTITNLQENLLQGFLFICIVAMLFLGDLKSPFVIGLSMLVSLVAGFVFFYLFGLSMNIISLSGLIMALGMMIDNSIIVTENISQYRERGYSLRRACVAGTDEVITPMISSSLTTIAVFVPLIFMSGIGGALFYDQAFSVTVGQVTSYFTGILLLPVLYYLVYRAGMGRRRSWWGRIRINNPLKAHTLDRFYDAGVDWVFAHKGWCATFGVVSVPLCVLMFYVIDKERMPRVEQVAEVAQQDYLLERERPLSSSEAEMYVKAVSADVVGPLQEKIYGVVKAEYPQALVTFAPPETVFEKLFDTGEADVVAELYARNRQEAPGPGELRGLERRVQEAAGMPVEGLAFEEQLEIAVRQERLLLYGVSYDEVYRTLRAAFKENDVAMLHSYQQYLPIGIVGRGQTVDEVLRTTLVRTQPDDQGRVEQLPLSYFVRLSPGEDLKTVTAGRNGEYVPLAFHDVQDAPALMRRVKAEADRDGRWDTQFSGSFFSNRRMLDSLVVILCVSVLLMYFILAAQFESFLQPLIVLLEIPVDLAFALVLLWACGHTLNLMSAIGLIVTCGVIINDSILKLDAINELRRAGWALLPAIHEAGRRRLRPIVMTALTSVCGMVPLLFASDMGSELQHPFVIGMMGAMLVGTLVSLFLIPLAYWFVYRRADAGRDLICKE